MEFKHTDTSPPKIYGQTEVAMPFEDKQDLPYQFQKNSGAIVAGVSVNISNQSIVDKKMIKDKNAILNQLKPELNDQLECTNDKKACGDAGNQPCVGTTQPCTTQDTRNNTGTDAP